MKLPFKVQPKPEIVPVGDESTGILDVPKYGDLSVNERIFIDSATEDLPDLRTTAVKIAQAISQETGQPLLETFNALTRGNADALGDHVDKLIDFQAQMEKDNRIRPLILATIMIRRLPGMEEWSVDDCKDASVISPRLVNLLAEMAQKELSGWRDAEPVTEEELGKLQTESTEEVQEPEPEPIAA